MGLPKPNEASTSKETMDTSSSGAQRKRGITSMHRIVKNKNTGKKLVVEYTPKGKPYGKVASELASYIGVLARTTVPISVESWPKVEKDLKNKIWESVEAAFVLAPKSRKMVLTSASNRWRQFKSDLTRKYIMPFKDEAEALKNPPEDYGFIKQQHWKQFVNGRLTKEFQFICLLKVSNGFGRKRSTPHPSQCMIKLHNEQKERRAKFQQPHRMSRKGYVGLEAESRKTMPEDELDGSLLCKKAFKDRKRQAAKIDLLTKEHSEHSDHSEHAKYAERGEHSEHTEQSEHAEPSEHAEHSEHSEHPKHSEHPEHSEHEEHSEHFDVSLLSKNNDVLTMALGAPEDSGRVRGVGGFFKPNVPQAQFDREYILDEVRKMIEQQRAWYEAKIAELEAKINGNIRTTPISLSTPVPNRSEKASCSGKKKNVLEDNAINFEELTVVGKRDTIKKRGKTAVKPQDLPKQDVNLPKSLKLLYRYAEHAMLNGETISIDMEEAVFGVARTVYISQEDVMQFMEMKEISATCIIVYMRHLYGKLDQSNMVDMVGLTDPSSISGGAGDSDQKSRVIAARLQKGSADQILLVPYNSGYHWMLTIISEDKDVCYFMDPLQRYFMDSLRRSMREEEWKYVVNNGIRQFNIQTGRGVRKPPVWKVLTGPKQPSNMECGYYVMRYMKEIVEDENLSFAEKWNGKTLNAYTQTELDEVRCEWTDIISDHM